MPCSEKQKREQEARRKALLKVLRKEYNAREELKSGAFVPKGQKISNANKDSTPAARRSRNGPPLHYTSGHTMKFDNENKMHIHKDSSSSAPLKRKAEDNEQGHQTKKAKPTNGPTRGPTSGHIAGTGKQYRGNARIEPDSPPSRRVDTLGYKYIKKAKDHEQGYKTKEVKPTSGYVPGTGRPYRGTARIEPDSPPSGQVRALGYKSVNAPLKFREIFSKQDTKNQNHNASKLKVPCTKGMSQTIRGLRKATEPEAVNGDETESIQETRRDTSKAARSGILADVKDGHPQGSKRKMGHDLDSKATKKARINPGTMDTQSLKTVGKAEDVGMMKKAAGESLGKRRREEDDGGSEISKKTKVSASKPDKWKVQSFEEELPNGLENHNRACFANAGLQGLFGVPELIKHYEACKEQISQKMQSIRGDTHLMRAGQATRGLSKKGEELNINLNRDECFISAYFGELVNTVSETPGKGSVSPYAFLQACGSIFKDENGRSLNGDTSQDTSQFLDELLKRLHDEEMMERADTADTGKPSFVEELFHVESGVKLVCGNCALARSTPSQPTSDCFGLKVILPTSEEPTTLGNLIDRTRTTEALDDYVCPRCKTIGMTTREVLVKKLPKCLIVHALRARHTEKQNGNRKRSIIRKNHTLVELPIKTLSLSSLLEGDKSNEAHRYEVFGTIQHKGNGTDNGHYVAMRKTNGQWYCIDDKKVELVSKEKLPSLRESQIFFLRRVE